MKWQPTPSTLAWKIPWTEEPGRLQSMGSQRVRHDWTTSLHSLHSLHTILLQKEMATHSSVFAWRIPWTEEPGGPWSMGSQRVGHDWSDWARKSVMLSNHLILCHPLLILPSIFPSIRVFSNKPALRIRWPKYWSFIFSNNPSNEYSELIFFRVE